MPLVPCITHSAPGTPLYAPAGSGGGGGPSTITSTFNQLFTSSISSADPVNDDFAIVGNGAYLVFDMTSGGLVDIQFKLSTSIGSGAQAPAISVYDLGNSSYVMSLNAQDGVALTTSISSLNVSSINGVAPGGAIPEDLVVNSVAASTFTASTINLQGFPVPVITYGATSLNAGGSTIVGPLDRTYTIPYYQMLTYRGNPVSASTLFASTIDGENFAVFGEPNLTFQYAIFGN